MGNPGADRSERARQTSEFNDGRFELQCSAVDRLGTIYVGRWWSCAVRRSCVVRRFADSRRALQRRAGFFVRRIAPQRGRLEEGREITLGIFQRVAVHAAMVPKSLVTFSRAGRPPRIPRAFPAN